MEGEGQRETSCERDTLVASHMHLTETRAGLNLQPTQPFGVRADVVTTEQHQPGQQYHF